MQLIVPRFQAMPQHGWDFLEEILENFGVRLGTSQTQKTFRYLLRFYSLLFRAGP